MTFLLCDPDWYVRKPEVQNKWDDNTHPSVLSIPQKVKRGEIILFVFLPNFCVIRYNMCYLYRSNVCSI